MDDIQEHGTVYILHYRDRYPRGKRPRHYIGWGARDAQARIEEHRRLTSRARLVEVMAAEHIPFDVAGTLVTLTVRRRGSDGQWEEVTLHGKELERHLKNAGHYSRRCPLCGRMGEGEGEGEG